MGCNGLASFPGMRLRVVAPAQSPRGLSAAAPPTPYPVRVRRRRRCCWVQGPGSIGPLGKGSKPPLAVFLTAATELEVRARETKTGPLPNRIERPAVWRREGWAASLTGAVAIPYEEGLSAMSSSHPNQRQPQQHWPERALPVFEGERRGARGRAANGRKSNHL